MSAAMARKRRAESSAVNQSSIPSNIGNSSNVARPNTVQSQNPGLTLPQVISVIDTRLIVLETFMKDTKEGNSISSSSSSGTVSGPGPGPVSNTNSIQETNEIMEEMDTRFDILAREIADLKDIVLKLQAYTMDVNKTLLEERIHILSDLGNSVGEDLDSNENTNVNPNFTLTDTLPHSNYGLV